MAAAGLLLLAFAAFAASAFFYPKEPTPGGVAAAPTLNETMASWLMSADGVLDSDGDAIPDALENFVYGTNASAWSTTGTGIPDGWVVRYGYDPLNPSLDSHPGAVPPPTTLPAAYGHTWPASYAATLREIYAWGRPADWDEATMGLYDNGLDPRAYDHSNDGIPTGWLLHYGLDPLAEDIGDTRLAGPDGLTVHEAFQYNTDPTKIDSDGDGLPDRSEIEGPTNPLHPAVGPARFPPTDPARFSTTQSGVCDGYLVAHGLDPTGAGNVHRDLAKSGATTLEKFQWSYALNPVAACLRGAGLDPRAVSTARGPVPDGWLLRHDLDPLDPKVLANVTESSKEHAGGPWQARTEPPTPDEPVLPELEITVLDEYLFGRPTTWNETLQGPWWGGTDPWLDDTDGDGLPDVVEMRGYYVSVATDLGSNAALRHYNVTSHPGRNDTSGDGLNDYLAIVEHGMDPNKRDTDLDGILDVREITLGLGLDPLRADTAGDHLRDGTRLDMLESRAARYREDSTYEYRGQPGVPSRKVTSWVCKLSGVQYYMAQEGLAGGECTLSGNDLVAIVGPSGNLSGKLDEKGKPVPNILNPDIDDDGLLNGWEVNPFLYDHASPFPAIDGIARRATDPLNPDTDGDQLADEWEIRYGKPVQDKVPPRYTLEPSAWSSLCDPTGLGDASCTASSDAEQELDEDGLVFTYFAITSGVVEARTETLTFPALLEQTYGTNPNKPSTRGDGLRDGWKVFWGIDYPNRLEQDPESVGIHRPTIPLSNALKPALNLDQADVTLATGPYTYFTASSPPPLTTLQARGETATEFNSVPLADKTANLYKVTGTELFTMLEAQAAGTNPYMAGAGTAGHGVPDWWLWASQQIVARFAPEAQCATETIELLDPEAWQADPDHDGLTTQEEFQTRKDAASPSTHPTCYSTTLTGFADQLMSDFDDPLDPRNAVALRDQTTDTDGDGLLDYEEQLGVFHAILGRHVKTEPSNPDTDGDGLLDGSNVALDPTNHNQVPWIRLYLDLGITYRKLTGGVYQFQGEIAHATHPLNPDDTLGAGVPAGWMVANDRDPKNAGAPEQAAYGYGVPAWWDVAAHGPWWGGVRPGQSTAALDRDRDGMDDIDSEAPSSDNGFEDPMPGANFHNVWRPLNWSAYPTVLGLGEPATEALPTDESLTPLKQRLLAQSYMNPWHEGPRAPEYPRASLTPPTRIQPCLDFDSTTGIVDDDDAPILRLRKGETAYLVGRIYTGTGGCSGDPTYIEGVTIDARMGTSSHSFGAGFTDAQGRFRIPLTINKSHEVEIPSDESSLVLRGKTGGTVAWDSEPAVVPPGTNNFLKLRTYKTAALGPLSAQGDSGTISVGVEAGSVLQLVAPNVVVTGKPFAVEFQLIDSGGAPLQDDVILHWGGKDFLVQPSPAGRGEVQLPAPDSMSGPNRTLTATSIPASRDYVDAANTSIEVALLRPVSINLDSLPSRVDPGQTFAITGHVKYKNSGVGALGLPVDVNITRAGETVSTTHVNSTGSGGGFVAALTFPFGMPSGEYIVVATAQPTPKTVGDTISDTLDIRGTPRFDQVSLADLMQGIPAPVSGRLVDFDGTPVKGAAVKVSLNGIQRNLTLADDGRFATTINQTLPGHPVQQTVAFSGNDALTPVTQRAERMVLSATGLHVPGGELARGARLDLPVQLSDGNNKPIAGAPIRVTWGAEKPVLVLTNATGVAHFQRLSDAQDTTGAIIVRAEYAGSIGGGHQSATTTATWMVRTLAVLDLPSGIFEAGTPIPPGTLTDKGSAAPLSKTEVTIEETSLRNNQTRSYRVVTDNDGRFEILETITRTNPADQFEVTVHFAGDKDYGPAEARSDLRIRAPVELATDLPARISTARPIVVDVTVRGLGGGVPDDGVVNATLNGNFLASAVVKDGRARLEIVAPTSTAAGPGTMTFQFDESASYAPADLQEPVHVLRAVLLTIETETAVAGKTATIRAIAHDGEQPLAFLPVHLEVEGIEGGLLGMTDGDGVATFQLQQPLESRQAAVRFAGKDDLNPTHVLLTIAPEQPPTVMERTTPILTWVIITAAAILAVLSPIVYHVRRSPLGPVLRRARRILDQGGPDALKILDAYSYLEESAIGLGLLPAAAQTAHALKEAILPTVPMAAHPALERLIRLFELARYGQATIDASHSRQAVEALESILKAIRTDAGLRWPIRFSRAVTT